MNLNYLTIQQAHKLLKEGKTTSVELTEASLKRIKEVDPKIKAFTSVFEKEAFEQAKKADEKFKKGEEVTELTGIPYAVKNNYSSFNQLAQASSNILKNFKSTYDATMIKRMNESGAILMGKTNCDAFGFGVSTENSDFWPSHNPWNLNKVPGGSSGGLGAALAAGCVIFGFGEDTGGSVRGPASLSGVTAIKPSYGLLSRYGIYAMACSYDCPGPMARTMEDLGIIINCSAGLDEKDSQTVERPEQSYLLDDSILKNIQTIGVPKQFMTGDIEKGTLESIKKAIEFYQSKGLEILDLDMPYMEHAIEVYYVLVPGEISSNLARYDGMRFAQQVKPEKENYEQVYFDNKSKGFGAEEKRRIMMGTFALSQESYKEYYEKACKVRTLIIKDFEKAFKKVDLIVGPVSPVVAWDIGKDQDPVKMYLMDVFTAPASTAGLPAASVPVGFDQGLPVGMQIIGKKFKEKQVLALGQMYEKEHEWGEKRPNI